MDKIGKVALGMSADAEVIVKTAMKMKNAEDKDDLYFYDVLISWRILSVW